MTEGTRTRPLLKELSIRVLSDKPLALVSGGVFCAYGLPLRYKRVEEGEIKIAVSLEKLRELSRRCEPHELVGRVLKELEYVLPEAVFTVVKVYADGVKLRELVPYEEVTPVGKGLIIDEEREPDAAIPPWAKENRDRLFNLVRELLLLELLFGL
ncbi:MAG: hypothetical protein GXO03_01405 [Aquificae bacterium]|nr:hypothetical protein [Aquificota bacterium]